MKLRRTGTTRYWWLNPPLLVGVFVAIALAVTVSASISDRSVRKSGNQYWADFIRLPAESLKEAVVIGTWRSDARFVREYGEPLHCGLRSYGLPPDGLNRFLERVDAGEAGGWSFAEGEGTLDHFVPGDNAFCPAEQPSMEIVRKKIHDAWRNPANPRYSSGALPVGVTIRGVLDRASRQAYFWFAVYPD